MILSLSVIFLLCGIFLIKYNPLIDSGLTVEVCYQFALFIAFVLGLAFMMSKLVSLINVKV